MPYGSSQLKDDSGTGDRKLETKITLRRPIIGISGGDGSVGRDLDIGAEIGRSIVRRGIDCILLTGGEPRLELQHSADASLSAPRRIQDTPLTAMVDEAARLSRPARFIAIPRHSSQASPPARDTRFPAPIDGLVFRDQNTNASGKGSSRRNLLVAAIPDILLVFKGGMGGGTLSEAAFAIDLGRPMIFVDSFDELARTVGAAPVTETIIKTVSQTESETQTVTSGAVVETQSQTTPNGETQSETSTLIGTGTQTDTQTQSISETITKTIGACKSHIAEHYDDSRTGNVFQTLYDVLSRRRAYSRAASLALPEAAYIAGVSSIADFLVDTAMEMAATYGLNGEYPDALTKSGLSHHKKAFDTAADALFR